MKNKTPTTEKNKMFGNRTDWESLYNYHTYGITRTKRHWKKTISIVLFYRGPPCSRPMIRPTQISSILALSRKTYCRPSDTPSYRDPFKKARTSHSPDQSDRIVSQKG